MRWLALVAIVACGSKDPQPDGTGGPAIAVTVRYPGASPDLVETDLVAPLEQTLVREPGVVTIRSVSSPSTGRIVLWFKPGIDERAAAQHATDVVAGVRAQLPPDAEAPTVSIGDPDAPPDFAYVVHSDTLPIADISRALERDVAPAVLSLPGVRRVVVTGARPYELQIAIDADRIRATGVTHDEVITALATAGRFSLEEAGNLVVAQLSHVPVLIRDVAALRIEASPPTSPAPLGLEVWLQTRQQRGDVEAALGVIPRNLPRTVTFASAPPRPLPIALAIELVGDDRTALEALADSLISDLSDIATVTRDVPATRDPVALLAYDKAAAARLNVKQAALDTMARAFAHQPIRARERLEDLPVVVELGPSLDAILVRATDGAAIPLSMLAKVETRPSAPLVRVNARRAIVLTVQLKPGGAVNDVQTLLDKHPRISHQANDQAPHARLVTRKPPQ